jgi:nitrite reductase/ring-hydroxylating ferredoxin subunit
MLRHESRLWSIISAAMSENTNDSYISTGVTTADLKLNQPKRIKTTNGFVLLLKLSEDEVVAFTPICPHSNGDMTYGHFFDGAIECPLHGWRFDVRSGACVEPEGSTPLRTFPIRIDDGVVAVEIARPKWMDA